MHISISLAMHAKRLERRRAESVRRIAYRALSSALMLGPDPNKSCRFLSSRIDLLHPSAASMDHIDRPHRPIAPFGRAHRSHRPVAQTSVAPTIIVSINIINIINIVSICTVLSSAPWSHEAANPHR
ncbi:MAG: hypothetical protein ABF545_05480 [Bifidobacterium psychraerophilum]|uniref:hypothetical protein n=1 Tax=Bifidobacterium psychraerophilum TaxID=218140 RepID=UPI0039EBF606